MYHFTTCTTIMIPLQKPPDHHSNISAFALLADKAAMRSMLKCMQHCNAGDITMHAMLLQWQWMVCTHVIIAGI